MLNIEYQNQLQMYNLESLQEEHIYPITKEKIQVLHEKYQTIQLEKWKQIQKTIYQINGHNELQTQNDMRRILEFYTLLNYNNILYDDNKNRWREVYLSDDKVFDYFMCEFFYYIAKYLIDEKAFEHESTLILSNQILLQSTYIFITTFSKQTIQTSEMLSYIFNKNQFYYRNSQLVYQLYYIQQLYPISDTFRQFQSQLKDGDLVDAIKTDSTCNKSTWSRAKVINSNEDYIQLEFLNTSQQFSKQVWRYGFEIRPYKTMCPDEDWEWRFDLKKGDLVDCCDNQHVWYKCTVFDVKTIDNETYVFLGYRYYDKNGNKQDSKGKFFGWQASYDEDIDVTSPRLQKVGTQAKKVYTKASTNQINEEIIDDYNDRIQIIEDENETVYAVPRRNYCVSFFLITILNKFGKRGGFQLLKEKISNFNENEWCPIDFLASYMNMLDQIQGCFHQHFAQKFAKELIENVQKNILESPTSNLRNFTKEKLDYVNRGLGSLIKRNYSVGQKTEILEKFNLKMAIQCFNSEFIITQLLGLKTIMEVLGFMRNDKNVETMQPEELSKWISENKLFQRLFHPSKCQLIQKSLDFFKFMLNEKMIQEEHLEILWQLTRKKDTELKLSVYKLLSEAFYIPSFTKDLIQFFIKKIIEIDLTQICTEDIELLQEFVKSTFKGIEMQQDVRDFYWKIIERSDEIQPNLVEFAIKAFSDAFSYDQQKEAKQQVLEICVQEIQRTSKSTLNLIKIMTKIIDGLVYSQYNQYTKKDAILFLYEEKEIVKVIVENIRLFKSELKTKFPENNLNEQFLEQNSQIKPPYLDQIKARIEFLNFVYNILPNDIMLTFDVICLVWDAVVVEGLMQKEKDLIYAWFSEINTVNNTSTNNNSGLCIKHEDLKQFFNEKLCSVEGLNSLTQEGFNCFKSVFCTINETEGKMKKYSQKQQIPMYLNNYGKQVYSYSNYNCNDNSNDQRTNTEFDYIMNDNPESLIGIEELWKIIIESENISLVKKALEFLNNLHTNFDCKKINESTEESIKTSYYEKVYNYIKQNQQNKSQIEKCLMILESIMDESEKRGNGGLKSLLCLSKQELITLHCTVQFYIQDVPNSFTVKIYSNDSLTDLLHQIGLVIKCSWEEVQLYVIEFKRDLQAKENGRSIQELNLKNGSKLLISKKKAPPVKEVPLILENNEINPLAINIFKKWFWNFAKDGKMKAEEIAQFTNSCTNDNCLPTDRRIVDCLQQYDKEKKGYLQEENFIEFYSQACRSKQEIVRRNLESYHYRRDLKRYDEIGVEEINVEKLPRYILSQNEEFFSLLFSLLDYQEVAPNVWKLLSRLPINPSLQQKLLQCEDWEEILNSNSVYKLMYNLHLMEYLLDIGKRNNNWAFQFIKCGGFDNLFKKFQNLQQTITPNSSLFERYMFSFILKMFQKYLVAAFSSKNSQVNIYKMVNFMSLGYLSLPSLILLMRKNQRETNLLMKRKESELKDELLEMEAKKFEAMEDEQQQQNQEKGQNFHEKVYNEIKHILEENEDFLQLVKSLEEQNLTEIILSKFENFDLLVDQFTNLCIQFTTQVNADKLEIEDRSIIEYSFLLLGSIFLYNKDISHNFFVNKQQKFQSLVSSCLLYKHNQNIRKNFNNFVYIISSAHIFPASITLNILKSELQNIRKQENAHICTQYFELFCSLLDILNENDTKDYGFDFPKLLQEVTEYLKSHQSKENSRQKNKNDKILIGLINLSDRIVNLLSQQEKETYGKPLIEEIFNKCLFDKDLKCKAEQSRHSSFQLLKSLCKSAPSNLNFLIREGLAKILEKLPRYNTGMRVRESRSECGYVGLYNLGCICYMNAMLQQFYMVPSFRYALLIANDGKEPNIVQDEYNKREIQTDDNVFHQLQKMFAYLEMTDTVDYNPLEFCYSFKDQGGNPVNTLIQQDAQEFLGVIFDKVENALKGSPFEKIVEGVFGGKTCSQLICGDCGHIKRNYETFFNVSLEVKNMKSLSESFNKYIQGETISDYKCENCQKKVDIVKNIHLSKLPNVLILHLQRIFFDLDSLQNIKLNSRLEFPNLLNLKQYMMSQENENQEENDFEYELVGVVVHTGTADYGHYYSYIDTNRGDYQGDRNNDIWLEFNDSKIKDFSQKNIESECFGGGGDYDDGNSFGGGSFNLFRGKDNNKSAYILVYEKRQKKDIELIFQNEKEIEQSKFKIKQKVVNENGKISGFVDFYEFLQCKDLFAQSNDNLIQKVQNDNNMFVLEKNIYNDTFYSFVKDVLQQVDIQDDLLNDKESQEAGYYVNYQDISEEKKAENISLINIHTKAIFDLFQRTSDQKVQNKKNLLLNQLKKIQIMQEMTDRLKTLLRLTPEYVYEYFCKTILPKASQAEIVKSQEQQMRQFLSEIYSLTTQIIINFNNLNLLEPQQNMKTQTILNFLNINLELLHDQCQKHLNKIEQYFDFWYNFISNNSSQIEYIYEKQIILYFIDFFLAENSPLKYVRKATQLNQNMRLETPPYNSLIQSILYILDAKYNMKNENDPQKNDLCADLKVAFFSNVFWDKLFVCEKIEPHILGRIIKKLSFKNQFCSEIVSLALTQGLFRVSYDDAKPYASAIQTFICIKDEFQQKRIEWVLGVPVLSKNFSKSESQCQDDRKYIINYYGTYGMNSLLDSFYIFISSLNHEQTKSVLELIHNTRKMQDNTCIQFVLAILNAANSDLQVLRYICLMPSPSCFFGKYIDLIFYFVLEYQDDSIKQKYSYFPKKTYAELTTQQLFNLQQKITQFYDEIGISTDLFEGIQTYENIKNMNLNGFYSLYTIGKTRKIEIIQGTEFSIADILKANQINNNKPSNQNNMNNNQSKKVRVYERQLNTYVTENYPACSQNKAYDNQIVRDSYIMSAFINNTSPWNAFFKQKIQNVYAGYNQLKETPELIENMETTFKNNETIREILIINESINYIQLVMTFEVVQETNNTQILPKTPLQFLIKPKQNEVIFAFQKIDLSSDWGIYKIWFEYSIIFNYTLINQTQKWFLSPVTPFELLLFNDGEELNEEQAWIMIKNIQKNNRGYACLDQSEDNNSQKDESDEQREESKENNNAKSEQDEEEEEEEEKDDDDQEDEEQKCEGQQDDENYEYISSQNYNENNNEM